MKKWTDDKTKTPARKIIDHLEDLVRQGYTLERLPIFELEYKGYPLTKNILLVTDFQLDERFAKRVEHSEIDQGYSLLHQVLMAAFQLGIERGIDLKRESDTIYLELIEMGVKHLKNDDNS